MCEYLKNNKKLQLFMSIIFLVAMSAVACSMDKVADNTVQRRIEKNKKGKVVVIDPGHGGDDPGKVGINNIKEKEVNLAISLKLRDQLINKGYDVVLTRLEDVILNDGDRFSKVGDLNERCRIINNTYQINKKCVMISIHQNSFAQQSVQGAQSFYYQRSEESKRLGEVIQNKFNEKINMKEKKAKPNDSYYMLLNSKCPGVILECGFLSNPDESERLKDEKYQADLAEIICEGIDVYFGEK